MAIATAALPLLGVFFLKHLLKLIQFLAHLRKRLLRGIGFLSAFLGCAEIGLFRSVFLKTTAIASIVRVWCTCGWIKKLVNVTFLRVFTMSDL
jgi:hypothetical protein